jgi:methylene-tetrahydromethanopterin dehydrogenase
MLGTARKAMVPPFEVSVFADPSGAFTTAAGMMAKVEHHLKKQFGLELAGRKVSIFGATGPVGGCTAVIAAKYGAQVRMVAHRAVSDVQEKADSYKQRYGVDLECVDGSTEALKNDIIQDTEIVLCCAAAGVQVISHKQIETSKLLKIVADVNAIPPLGAEGVDMMADGVLIHGTTAFGIGALCIGNVKYNAQLNLLKLMLESNEKHYLDFLSAFEIARNSL